MFRLFNKLIVKNKPQKIEFDLSDDVEIIIEVNEPPFFSRGYLFSKGEKVCDVAIHPEKVETIQKYASANNEESNELLLAKLKDLDLEDFVKEIEKYIEPTPPAVQHNEIRGS